MLLTRDNLQSALLIPAEELREGGAPALVVDLDSISSLPAPELQNLVAWCRQQPFPVIGLGDERLPAADCVDVVAANSSELKSLQNNICRNPNAATVLVQVLRTIEHLPPTEALVVESLGYATLQSGTEFASWLKEFRAKNVDPLTEEDGPALVAEREGDALHLVLNRPQSRNAYTVELRDALTEVFRMVNLDASIRTVNVRANGPCFSSGGELTEFGVVADPVHAHIIRSSILPAKFLLQSADRYHFHVHKACIGSGIELPAFAGRLTADPKTLFWLPELTMGLIPGAGGCVSISKRIGRRRTAYLVLMNKKINAEKALAWGLIDGIESH